MFQPVRHSLMPLSLAPVGNVSTTSFQKPGVPSREFVPIPGSGVASRRESLSPSAPIPIPGAVAVKETERKSPIGRETPDGRHLRASDALRACKGSMRVLERWDCLTAQMSIDEQLPQIRGVHCCAISEEHGMTYDDAMKVMALQDSDQLSTSWAVEFMRAGMSMKRIEDRVFTLCYEPPRLSAYEGPYFPCFGETTTGPYSDLEVVGLFIRFSKEDLMVRHLQRQVMKWVSLDVMQPAQREQALMTLKETPCIEQPYMNPVLVMNSDALLREGEG